MSASEMLRALDAGAEYAPWERATSRNAAGDGPVIKHPDAFDWIATVQVSNVSNWRENAELIVALRNALPLLADVVEAAEIMLDPAQERVTADFRLNRTLTALREHLEGGA